MRKTISGGPYYVKLRRHRLIVRATRTGRCFDDEPLVALSNDEPRKIIAIGASARSSSGTVINPFLHPRILVADYLLAEKLMAHAFRVVSGLSTIRPAAVVVVHVLEPLEGGLSSIEARAIRELCDGAGASMTHIWDGHELTDEELASKAYLAVA